MKLKNLTIEHLWVLFVLGFCFAYICYTPINQNDFWHYLKAGEVIFQTGKILDKDLFTFTIFGNPYANLHWGSEVIYYLLYLIGGVKLILFTHAALITIAFTLVFLMVLSKTNSLRIASIATLISAVISSSNFTLRPQGFSILFFALTFYLLKTRRLRMIPVLFLIWANIHGAFPMGLVLIFAELLGEIKRAEILLTLLFSFIATLFTPWGLNAYLHIINVEPISRQVSFINEWNPSLLNDQTGIIFFFALIILFVLLRLRRNNLTFSEQITLIIFTLLALRWQRAVIWWGIVTAPLFADGIKKVLPIKALNYKDSKSVLNIITLIFFVLFLVSSLPWIIEINPLLPDSRRQIMSRETPIHLALKLQSIRNTHRIFNNFPWGSYFIWALRDDQKIFYDPRVDIFPKEIIKDYFCIYNGQARWKELLNKYKVDTLALNKREEANLISLVKKSSSWKQVYEDELGFIFIKG